MSENHHTYFKEIQHQYKTKDTTEHSFRTQLENFLKSLNPKCSPLHESKRDRIFGTPDFKIFFNGVKIGYIETKDLGANLDEILDTLQIKKYTASISNLILTNYCRFILLRNGECVLDVSLFSPSNLDKTQFKISNEKINEFDQLIDSFLSYKSLTIKTPESLAFELSKKAILIKDIAKEQLKIDRVNQKNGESYTSILDFYEGVKELIHDISDDDCVDAYAQTITYGLFLAKNQCKGGGTMTRDHVDSCLPRNIPIIRRIFRDISGSSLPHNLIWVFDEILDVLNSTDIDSVFEESDKRGKSDRDPFSHFYEDFLQLYDPAKRERRGVYYTPRPVVNYIVKSVEWSIKNNFEKQLGYADDNVTVLDPATGTGTFLYFVYLRTLTELVDRKLNGLINSKIRDQALKNFYGLEILITPYIIAHLKLGMLLNRWHYEFKEGERVQVYLTNSLDQGEDIGLLPYLKEINEERRVAHNLVMNKPILAIIGNPPYSGMSANKGEWIDRLLKEGYARFDGSKDDGYYKVDGSPLGERNPKWLQDDYVKFIRFAQWKIDKAGEGVIGFITNHAYLDNPTFRGMRCSLLQSFQRIYILNLHGNTKKNEKCPDGSKDENVFDIQQGTAIVLLVKNPGIHDRKIKYFDLYGLREVKYQYLDRNTLFSTEWQDLEPTSPYYLFVPTDLTLQSEYDDFVKITDIFPQTSIGIITARDNLTIKWTSQEVLTTITKFSSLPPEEARRIFDLGKDARDWKVEQAQKDLIDSGLSRENIFRIFYRPFDIRYTYYTGTTCGFHCMPRHEIMRNMIKPNLAIHTCRQISGGDWQHVLVSDCIADDCYVSNKTKERGYIFPLYLYKENQDDEVRQCNINSIIISNLEERFLRDIQPDDIFYYVYGVLHSKKYRKRYVEFLKRDFPKIPFTDDYVKFTQIASLGKSLVELHLEREQLPPTIKYEIFGNNKVESIKYVSGKLYINKTQYFDNISEDIWNFHIGGYQVLDRWLKYRKNRELSDQEILHFIQIVEILKETIRLMNEIDKINLLP
jgi:predicted helicase